MNILKEILVCLSILFFSAGYLNSQSLADTKWELIQLKDTVTKQSSMIEIKAKTELSFTSDSTYRGYVCNHYNGQYLMEAGGGIKMGRPSSTRISCSGGINAYENKLFNLYKMARAYALKGQDLYVYSGTYELVFRKN